MCAGARSCMHSLHTARSNVNKTQLIFLCFYSQPYTCTVHTHTIECTLFRSLTHSFVSLLVCCRSLARSFACLLACSDGRSSHLVSISCITSAMRSQKETCFLAKRAQKQFSMRNYRNTHDEHTHQEWLVKRMKYLRVYT